MEGISVINDVKRGVISLVYLFYGAERLLLQEALDSLTKFLAPGGAGDFNYEKFDAGMASPSQVVNAANLLPVFAEKRLVVVTGVPWFSSGKGGEEESKNSELSSLLTYLENPSPSTCLVLVAGEKIDGKRKIVKTIKKTGQVIEFTSPKGIELNEWMDKSFREMGKKAARRAIDYLAVAVGNNMSLLEQEIEKVSLFVGPAAEVTLQDVMQTVSVSSNLTVFNLVDAVSKKDSASAVFQLRELVKNGEPEIKILALLARQMRILLQIQSLRKEGLGESQIAADLGLHPFVVKKGLQQSNYFTAQELINALEILLETDVKFKTGKGDHLALLETAILRM
ncbi:MAG: DNA polymerase III subunit delta [Dehalobacterium sp.]